MTLPGYKEALNQLSRLDQVAIEEKRKCLEEVRAMFDRLLDAHELVFETNKAMKKKLIEAQTLRKGILTRPNQREREFWTYNQRTVSDGRPRPTATPRTKLKTGKL